jgi:3-oxoacyl-[acyl-carrier protein] reductase
MDLGLQGRVALVTGGSSGLGLESARALWENGVEVILVSRDATRLAAAKAQLELDASSGNRAPIHTLAFEISDAATIPNLIAMAHGLVHHIDIVIANAGGPPSGGLFDVTEADLNAAVNRNFLAMASLVRHTIDPMIEARWGRIIAITSLWVRQPSPNLILSNAARSGLTSYLKTASQAVAQFGVTINTLQPGLHETERLTALYHGDLTAAARSVPSQTLGRARDFGAVAAFLASEQARYINGASIPIDGGLYSGLM